MVLGPACLFFAFIRFKFLHECFVKNKTASVEVIQAHGYYSFFMGSCSGMLPLKYFKLLSLLHHIGNLPVFKLSTITW